MFGHKLGSLHVTYLPFHACTQDSMTSFAISEDGQLYSALTSSNTCALVDVGVSQGKAAWEFLLEEDSPRYVCYFGEHTASAKPYQV